MSENYNHSKGREEIFSKRMSSRSRTYFFDVKATKANDYYVSITESKKRMGDDGTPFYEKHKIFVYREDFDNFLEGMNETINRIRELRENPESAQVSPPAEPNPGNDDTQGSSFTDVSFEDLK